MISTNASRSLSKNDAIDGERKIDWCCVDSATANCQLVANVDNETFRIVFTQLQEETRGKQTIIFFTSHLLEISV